MYFQIPGLCLCLLFYLLAAEQKTINLYGIQNMEYKKTLKIKQPTKCKKHFKK